MPSDKTISGLIRKYTVKNAIDYGRPNASSILGKVLSKSEDARKRIEEVKKEIEKEAKSVAKLNKEELEKEYSKYSDEFEKEEIKKAEQAIPKMVLSGAVKGNFTTRYAPGPNGYMHIGHAKAAFLASEFAKIYNGNVYLYFDDTNPEKDKQEYVDAMKRDLGWLGIEFNEEYYASDSIPKEYDYARELLKSGHLYVCTCSQERLKDDRFKGAECEHRANLPEENISQFEELVKGKFEEGAAIVRFKGEMQSKNTAMRDPTLFRIKKVKHYRQGTKYKLWPTYDFNTPINDSIHGVTDTIRSKEYELRDELNHRLLDLLNLRKPRIHPEARLVIKNNITHKRELNKLIDERVLKGWDDPRLVTISALRGRGIQPMAIKEFVLRSGMSKTDAVVSMEMLLAENRSLIDPIAKHLFFVDGPVKLTAKGVPVKDVKLRLHPSKEYGFREHKTAESFYVSAGDAKQMKTGEIVSLKDMLTVKITSSKPKEVLSEAFEGEERGRIIQWVPASNHIECTVLVPEDPLDPKGKFRKDSLKKITGFVEEYASRLKEGEIVQFERFGYCVLHDKKRMEFIFTSK